MHEFSKDLRQAFRYLFKKPLVTGLAILSLALGIGVNSSIFSIVNAILLRDPMAADPSRLVEVYTSDSGGFQYATSSYPDYLDMSEQSQDVLSGLLGQRMGIAAYDHGDGSELLFGEEVSGNYFDVLGVPPALGRGFTPDEADVPGGDPVVVLGHGFWQRHLNGDAEVVGKSVKLSGVDFTVIGVGHQDLKGLFPGVAIDYWIPITMHDVLAENPSLDNRGSRSMLLRGRLADGVSVEQAQARFDALGSQLAAAYPETNEGRLYSLVPTREVAINPGFDGKMFGVAGILMAIVGMVLLIACSNIANLLLARAADRRKEIAIRLALGSGRLRLIRQLLTESLLLAFIGGGLGLLIALWISQLIVEFQPPLPIPLAIDLGLDWKVMGFTLLLALLTGILCGLVPALQASKPDVIPALKDEVAKVGRGYRRFGMRNFLVVAQVMVSTLLLIGAGLFVRSLGQAHAIDPGFELKEGVATTIFLGMGNRYTEEEGRIFLQQLQERAQSLPGARSAALVSYLPLSLTVESRGFQPEGMEIPEDERGPSVNTSSSSPGAFATLGIELRHGRDFAATDTAGSQPVVIVNETFARRYWPGKDPIGQRLRFGDEDPWREVIGVAADGKYVTLGEEAKPFVYRNMLQDYDSMATLVVATDIEEGAMQGQVRSLLDQIDPNLAIFDQKLMSEHLAVILFPARMGAALLSAFGLLGLLLASIGLYGVVAYSVSQRTREVGIRVAIGAGRGDVFKLVVREGMTLVVIGIALGLGLAMVATKALSSLLYGIAPSDPLTFAGVSLLLASVALVANLLPARRAMNVEPMIALRYE